MHIEKAMKQTLDKPWNFSAQDVVSTSEKKVRVLLSFLSIRSLYILMISLHHLKQNFLFSLKNLSCSWSPINQDLSWLGHHIIQENRFSLKVYSNNMHGFGFFQQFLVSCSSNGTQLYQLTQFLIHFYKKNLSMYV